MKEIDFVKEWFSYAHDDMVVAQHVFEVNIERAKTIYDFCISKIPELNQTTDVQCGDETGRK
jgi:hypothetical protein